MKRERLLIAAAPSRAWALFALVALCASTVVPVDNPIVATFHIVLCAGVTGEFTARTIWWVLQGRRIRTNRARGLCVGCGYDLASTPTERCPECGYQDPSRTVGNPELQRADRP